MIDVSSDGQTRIEEHEKDEKYQGQEALCSVIEDLNFKYKHK